ncbi:MAG TPA: hypothetical protein VLU73_04980 [Methylococcaceae bacterium]|jgi:hypothetical protein|nr:hypothetical protein [Methylococcaceae bacterium]
MNESIYPTNPTITARIARSPDLEMSEIKALWKQLFDKEVYRATPGPIELHTCCEWIFSNESPYFGGGGAN